MSESSTCKTCNAPDQEHIEAIGLKAMEGRISWNQAMKSLGWTNVAPLKNHMTYHFVAPEERELAEVEDQFQESIDEAVSDLFVQMRMAAPEVKPLYATAIQNLRGLRDTKPSQQSLILAMKTIQEMTGMKQEQRLLVQFAEHMFRELPRQAEKALPAPKVIDIEELSFSDRAAALAAFKREGDN